MNNIEHFRGHYDEWTELRLAYLQQRLGPDWFAGKRVLELGCGHAAIGRRLVEWGAHVVAVDGRPEHLEVARRMCPQLETVCADLNHQWPLEGRFDLILNLGLLYHLEDAQFVLDRCFAATDLMVLETEILDSLDPDRVDNVVEDASGYDQSLTGQGIRPTAGHLERLFDQHGFYAFRLAGSDCNTTSEEHQKHIYDWPVRETGTWQSGLRRMWVLKRKSLVPAPQSENISVVVQGPVVGLNDPKPRRRFTQKCLAAVRKHLPHAEIILSTSRESEVTGLDFDLLVRSEDPGGIICDDLHAVRNNVNRQIVSSQAGAAQSRRTYCLKLRSDLVLESARFLAHWERYPLRQWGYRFTAARMLASAIYSRRRAGIGEQATPMPFHPSDFLFFGFREDVQALFDVPACPEPETSRWFCQQPRPAGVFDCYSHAHCRFFPEQYLWLSFLKKFIDLPWRDRLDLENPCLRHDLPSQVNNLVVLDQSQWNFSLPKYMLRQYALPEYDWQGLYRYEVWRRDYNTLCGGAESEALTYDARMRHLFHDSLPARTLHRAAPKVFRYLQKKIRKQRILRQPIPVGFRAETRGAELFRLEIDRPGAVAPRFWAKSCEVRDLASRLSLRHTVWLSNTARYANS